MKKFLICLFISLISVFAFADNYDSCAGEGPNDYVVAEIQSNGSIKLQGYGSLYDSSVLLKVNIQLPNGSIIDKSKWADIRSGSKFVLPSYFGDDIPSGSKFIQVQVSNPKCH